MFHLTSVYYDGLKKYFLLALKLPYLDILSHISIPRNNLSKGNVDNTVAGSLPSARPLRAGLVSVV